jgi:hypothetical protein
MLVNHGFPDLIEWAISAECVAGLNQGAADNASHRVLQEKLTVEEKNYSRNACRRSRGDLFESRTPRAKNGAIVSAPLLTVLGTLNRLAVLQILSSRLKLWQSVRELQ